MKKILTKILLILLLCIPANVFAQSNTKFAISFTGIGCPHCAKVAPVLHKKVDEGGFILIEYEIYKNLANPQILNNYSDKYGLSLGIPQLMFDKDSIESGDSPIIENLDTMVENAQSNLIYLPNGSSTSFEELKLSDLNRYPAIYSKDRAAIRKDLTKLKNEQETVIKNFIYADTVSEAIKDLSGKEVKETTIDYPAGKLTYEHGIEINGWQLLWNGDKVSNDTKQESESTTEDTDSNITFGKVISLGLADSVNPCAISILALVLISIITYNPGNRKKVLLAGLSFIIAVIIMYLLYGFLIIKAFEVVQSITTVREFLYGKLGINLILGIGAIILGLLGLKDFFSYKPGGVGTEMPLFLRPKVNKLIAKVTSPFAAFIVGLFVTLFLLPCTIGPYLILGGLVAGDGFIKALPSLILYNIIFILPMLATVILVYIGTKKVEDVKDWKDRNIRYMHLIAGVLLLLIGILMVLGKF
ncbi:hypothetical protein KBB42_01645 [Candidatus Dojkabacteria bacterium]|nr:hypothetical protein [Candidatus Dojkabacteria bacterium]